MNSPWQKIKTGALYGLGFALSAIVVLFFWFGSSITFVDGNTDDGLDGKSFYSFPIDERVQRTSAIAIVKAEMQDGKLQCRFTEILKLAPDVYFNFKVGSVFSYCKNYRSGELAQGDALVLYFYGDPPSVRASSFIAKDGDATSGGMSVSDLRRLIKAQSENIRKP